MTGEFTAYWATASVVWFLALVIVGPRRTFDLSRCVGWYFLVFYLTYMLRPLGTEIMGDTMMYDMLRIDPMEKHWQLMAFAVSMAIAFFAFGYRIGVRGEKEAVAAGPGDAPRIVEAKQAYKVAIALMVWGYVTLIIAILAGQAGGPDAADVAGANMGVYNHNTAYFMQSDLFASTGSLLYYILTDRLGMSLLLVVPWCGARVVSGWARNVLLGHFFALMSIFFLKARLRGAGKLKSSQVALIGLAVVVTLCLFPFMASLRSFRSQVKQYSSASEAVQMVASTSDPVDMMQTYLGTNSSISGFEPTLYHLLNDRRAEWGTKYLYYYFFQPIPRMIFPGKGTPYTWPYQLLGIDMDPRIALLGMAPGAVGGAFEQWGWIGIPAEFLFTGWLIGWAEERARRKPNVPYIQMGYAGLYSMMPLLGRSPLLNMIPLKWSFAYGIPVIILWLVHKSAMARVRMARERAARSVESPIAAAGSTA